MAKAEEGMKVHVILTDDLSESQLQGTITKVEQLIVEETDEVLSEHFPTITLDDGRIVNGMECWWSPLDEKKQQHATTNKGEQNMKFRKKPVEIKAIQWDGTENGMWEIADKLDIYQDAIQFLDVTSKMVCNTLEGPLVATKGDWIIKGIKGEVYPCKPDIFDLTYNAVN